MIPDTWELVLAVRTLRKGAEVGLFLTCSQPRRWVSFRVVTEVWDLLIPSPENLEESYQAQQTVGRTQESARGHILRACLLGVLSREGVLILLGLLAGPF